MLLHAYLLAFISFIAQQFLLSITVFDAWACFNIFLLLGKEIHRFHSSFFFNHFHLTQPMKALKVLNKKKTATTTAYFMYIILLAGVLFSLISNQRERNMKIEWKGSGKRFLFHPDIEKVLQQTGFLLVS